MPNNGVGLVSEHDARAKCQANDQPEPRLRSWGSSF